MSAQQIANINQLLGQFLDLQESWESAPEDVDWDALKRLAAVGANAYNEGNGLSFQILAIDGMAHGEFHLRFLEYSVAAGFDPFKIVSKGVGTAVGPVFPHEAVAYAAEPNPWAAKMQASLQALARRRFGRGEGEGASWSEIDIAHLIECCGDSIPAEVLENLSPALAAASVA